MIGLIRFAASSRNPQLNKRKRAKPPPRRPRRPRRASRSFLVTRPRVLPLRQAVTGCGTRRITIHSISPPTRPGVQVLNKRPAKAIGSTDVVCVTMATLRRRRRRPRRRRSVERGLSRELRMGSAQILCAYRHVSMAIPQQLHRMRALGNQRRSQNVS